MPQKDPTMAVGFVPKGPRSIKNGFTYKSKKRTERDADGLTPEEVHDIRYSGFRQDTLCVMDVGDGNPNDVAKCQAQMHYKLANIAAGGATEEYRLMMAHDIREKLLRTEAKFDAIGMEAFAVMHMMRAFLGKEHDHAPIEATVVRLRLATGVEKDFCHVFPSPLPMPFGKSAEYQAAEKEWHEIGSDTFNEFDSDFIRIFYKILITLQPKFATKSMQKAKFPLVICKPHGVQSIIMMFEYLHQRALLAQAAKLPTAAPADFVVPEKLMVPFCDSRSFDAAIRGVLRELQLVSITATEEIDVSFVNHCPYHMTTNKLTCTTYCASEIVENVLVFSRFWGHEVPARFVDPYHLEQHVDFTGFEPPYRPQSADIFEQLANSSTSSGCAYEKQGTGSHGEWSHVVTGRTVSGKEKEDSSSEHGSDYSEEISSAIAELGRGIRKGSTFSPDVYVPNRIGSGLAASSSDDLGSSSDYTDPLKPPTRQHILRRMPRSYSSSFKAVVPDETVTVPREFVSSPDRGGPTPSPTQMGGAASMSSWNSSDFNPDTGISELSHHLERMNLRQISPIPLWKNNRLRHSHL